MKKSQDLFPNLVLRPCPFCGRPGEIEINSDHHGTVFNLGCGYPRWLGYSELTCPGHLVYYTEPIEDLERAVVLWNGRVDEKDG